MKKCITILLTFIMTLTTFTGCQKDPMKVPEYPLKKADVEAALEKVDFPCAVSDETFDSENRTSISLRDEEGRLIAGIASETVGNARFLGFSLIGYRTQGEASVYIPEEQWEEILGLGVILYGGLTDQNQVYEDFIKNFEKESIITELEAVDEQSYVKEYEWIKSYGDIFCSIIAKETGDGIREISSFKFYNDPAISNTRCELSAKNILNRLFTSSSIRYENYLEETEGKYSQDLIDTEFLESEYSESYLKRYQDWCTENCLENMEKAGLFTLIDSYAYEKNANIFMTGITLREQENDSQEDENAKSYIYTATLTCKNENETGEITVEGAIAVEHMIGGWKATEISVMKLGDMIR